MVPDAPQTCQKLLCFKKKEKIYNVLFYYKNIHIAKRSVFAQKCSTGSPDEMSKFQN